MARLKRFVVLCALLVAVVGCDGINSSSDPANFRTRLAGRVINGETQQPVSGVTVKVCNFEQSGSTDGDGHWFIEIIPGIVDSYVKVTFERSGFGSLGTEVGVFPDTGVFEGALQNRHFLDLGTTVMRPGEPATVHVTRDGAPLAAATLFAVPEEFAFDSTDECTDLNIVATTDASGVATLNNLDPTRGYEVVVPEQDLDGDGTIDIHSANSYLNISETGPIIAINTRSHEPGTGPEITGTNLVDFTSSFYMPTGTVADDQGRAYFQPGNADLNTRQYYRDDEAVGFSQGVVTPSGSVQVVFWNPVEIFEPNFLYRNNLVSFADPDWNRDLRIDATPIALAGSNSTIFNFTPVSPLPSNEVVTLNFIARSLVNPASSSNLRIDFYVPLRLSTIPVGIDNYNGSRDGSGGDWPTYLRFAEAVEGFYKVLSFDGDDTSITFEDPFEVRFQFDSDDEIINNQAAAPATGSNVGMSGAVAGKQYATRIRLPAPYYSTLNLNDDTLEQTNTVTVEISVRNIIGVTLDGVFTLPVE